MSRPRSPSVCHHEATRSMSCSRSPSRSASAVHTGSAPTICSSRGRGAPSKPTGSTPRASARRGHIHRQRKTSPLAMLKAWLRAAGVVAAQCICSARMPASVMSVSAFHWVSEPGNTNGRPVSRADGGLDGERLAHVHRVADGVADDGVRAVDAPGEPVTLGRLPELVLLGVVEVRVGQAGLVLVERGVRDVPGAVGLERAQVVLEAGHERDVPHRPGRPHRGQHVAHDAGVDLDVLGLGGLARPGGDEHVRRRVSPPGRRSARRRR